MPGPLRFVVLGWYDTKDICSDLGRVLLNIQRAWFEHSRVSCTISNTQKAVQLFEYLKIVPPQLHAHYKEIKVTSTLQFRQARDGRFGYTIEGVPFLLRGLIQS